MLKKIIPIIIGVVLLVFIGKITIANINVFPFLFQLLFSRDISLKKTDGNINILLLGIGGGAHEGPDLTDTVIFGSIDQAKNKVNLISIPRDLWIPDLNAKINTAYESGESKTKGGGILITKKVVSKVLSQPIDYVVRIDFVGFVKAVDILGGIDVNVENSLDDYEYPISGKEDDLCGHTQDEIPMLATASSQLDAFPCRYMHIHFDKGLQHMDGKRALEFVRSRHAQGNEGTDFARSKRQELTIKAVKDKALSLNVLLNPTKLIGLYGTLQESIDTNIGEDEFDDFIRLFQKMSRRAGSSSAGKNLTIQSTVLDYGDEKNGRASLLINPPVSKEFNYAWVLIPRIGNGNFSEVQKYTDCEIKIGDCPISKKPLN